MYPSCDRRTSQRTERDLRDGLRTRGELVKLKEETMGEILLRGKWQGYCGEGAFISDARQA